MICGLDTAGAGVAGVAGAAGAAAAAAAAAAVAGTGANIDNQAVTEPKIARLA